MTGPDRPPPATRRALLLARELRELGWQGSAYRVGFELGQRLGIDRYRDGRHARHREPSAGVDEGWVSRSPFAIPPAKLVLEELLDGAAKAALLAQVGAADAGRIIAFGRWIADHGSPIDWHQEPDGGARWPDDQHWSLAQRGGPGTGDIKLVWEVGRFPQAYALARAARRAPSLADDCGRVLSDHVRGFIADNPYPLGVHWASGQEIALRIMAWAFALPLVHATAGLDRELLRTVAGAIATGAEHIERHIGYARHAVYNNHLLSEALGLMLAGQLLQEHPRAARWRDEGHQILTEQAGRQFYPDGGYIQQSHNYQRLACQVLLWACAVARTAGGDPDPAWIGALDRSLDFLGAAVNPDDGRLPNYGANDGALPSPLSSCAYHDFRPTLQAMAVVTRGERRFPPGPWDEEALWFAGSAAAAAPYRPAPLASRSFAVSGHHLLRGRDGGHFGAFRCGSVLDRFSQIDMLHLDVWWRGHNVLADGGSYLYNGPAAWNAHFVRTASHNTVQVEDWDQMVHARRFKCLYWTQAELLSFERGHRWMLAAGEHRGFERELAGCVHRRAVLLFADELWLVVDRVAGSGTHPLRLHWLAGCPGAATADGLAAELKTPAGGYRVAVYDEDGVPRPLDVVSGRDEPPRGWISRHYGRKRAVPSIVARADGPLPCTMISVLGPPGASARALGGGRWELEIGGRSLRLRLRDGIPTEIAPEDHR
jgi:asparagine synthase (glutamine-hydrolysing)